MFSTNVPPTLRWITFFFLLFCLIFVKCLRARQARVCLPYGKRSLFTKPYLSEVKRRRYEPTFRWIMFSFFARSLDICFIITKGRGNATLKCEVYPSFYRSHLQAPGLPCGYKGSSKNPAQTSCEYSCAGGITQ